MNECIPMLSLAGKPTKERITKMLAYYDGCGVQNVMLYPRSGCEIEYMSGQWRDLCCMCIEYAAAHGMHIWLYDEYNFPSGSCGGKVTADNESFMSKRFVVTEKGVSVERIGATEQNFGITQPFCTDLLNPEAVNYFIELTHQKYYEWFGDYFGNTISGIFTDEPSFFYSICNENQYAYYDGIDEDYYALSGCSIYTDILDYHLKKQGRFTEYYFALIAKRFSEAYVGTISKWCGQHHIMLTGHMMCDHSVEEGISTCGNIFSVLSPMQLPGIDDIFSDIKHDDYLFSQIQALRASGKKEAMAELFALGPCSMPVARRRQMLWYAASYGVNRYFLAISHLDGRGNFEKFSFFNNFSYAMPNADTLKAVAKNAEEAAVYADKTPDALVSIRYPYHFCVRNYKTDLTKPLDELLRTTIEQLHDMQIPWKLICENDTSDTEYTLSVTESGLLEERTGTVFNSAELCINKICDGISRRVTVTEENGQLAKGLLVKSYTDGSYIIIDPETEKHGERVLLLNGSEKFTLACFGVHTDKTATVEVQSCPTEIKNAFVRHNHKNVTRSVFDERKKWTVYCECDIDVTLNARFYPEPSEVYFNGSKLNLTEKSTGLGDCFNDLYRKAERIKLRAGKNTFESSVADLPYMPSVIIEGNFQNSDGTLSARKTTEGIDGEYFFFGSISAVFNAEIPESSKPLYLTYDDNMLLCDLYINGEKVGQQAYAPYKFEIPEKYRGCTAEFELRFFSSIAPLFGKVAESTSKEVWWIPSEPEKLVLRNIAFSTI